MGNSSNKRWFKLTLVLTSVAILSGYNNCSDLTGASQASAPNPQVHTLGSNECGYLGNWEGTRIIVNRRDLLSGSEVKVGDQIQFVTELINEGRSTWAEGEFGIHCSFLAIKSAYEKEILLREERLVPRTLPGARVELDLRLKIPELAEGHRIEIQCNAERGSGFCGGDFTRLEINGRNPSEFLVVRSTAPGPTPSPQPVPVCENEGSYFPGEPGYSSAVLCEAAYAGVPETKCILNPNGNGCWIPQQLSGGGESASCRVDGSYRLPQDRGYSSEAICLQAMGDKFKCEVRSDNCWHPIQK